MKKLKVDKSKIAGKGLFTTDVFKKGEMIGLAHENDQPTTSIGKNHNHSDNPNAVSIKLGNKRYLMAKRPLKKGEEITTNYRLQPELEQPEDFAKGGTVIPLVEDAGLMNEDGFWVPDWETIAMQAKQLGAKTVKTKSGVIIYFDDNWKVQSVDENPQMKKGGTPKSLVKMPKPSKQGLASKKFSKSLEATNRLFTENRLFAKPKSRKRKVFDPGANYQDGGTTTPEDYAQFQTFAQTLPSNLQDSNFEYGNPDQYDLYGMWETVGKPGSFADVQDSEYFPLDEDGTYHGFTVGADGTFLKPMSHNTTWKEVMNSQLSLDPYFQENRLIRNEQGRLQYIPKAEYGMPLGAGMSQNYQGRRKFIHQDGGITSQEEIDAGNNAMMKARLAYAYMHGNPAAQRMVVAPDQPYVFDDGNTGTHFMASMDNYAVPLIQDVNGQLMLGDFGPESAEAIRFDNPEDAMYFAENYKQITPDESYRKENPEEDYIEAELTEEEIEEYRKGGFIVEEIDTYQKGGESKRRKKDSKGRYRSKDGNVRTPLTSEMQAEMSPEEWGQYVQEVPEVYTTRTREQQDIRNALDYQQRMAELYPGRPTQSDAIQPADWFWQLGMTGPAALKGANAAMKIPLGAGVNVGGVLNTAMLAHGVTEVDDRYQDWQDVVEGNMDWKEAALKTGMTALELSPAYGAAKQLSSISKTPSMLLGSPNAPIMKSGMPNPLALADAIVPRLPHPIRIPLMGMSYDGLGPFTGSPLNFLPGYGKNLGKAGNAFRKFGNTMEYVQNTKTLSPKGGSPFRMGKDQIVSEGNWAALNEPWENYSGTFAAEFDFAAPGSNLGYVNPPSRTGVLITDRAQNTLVEVPVSDPGLSFHRRLPFSNRYVPINKEKLLNNQFQLATQGGHFQSLVEKYGYGLAYAGLLGAMGNTDAVKQYNKYTIDPVINEAKKIINNINTEIVPEEEFKKGGEPKKKKRKTDDYGRYRSEDGNIRTPLTPEMQAVMPPDEWGQYIQEFPEVYTTRTKEQQEAMNAARNMQLLNELNYQRAPHLYLPDGSLRPQAAQSADWVWQLGTLGAASGLGRSAVGAAESLGSRALPYIEGALNTSIPGMASIPGATVGNALGAMAAVDSGRRLLDVPGQVQKGEYTDAAANVLTAALDIGTAGIISPLYKGAKATATELKAALEAKNPSNFKIPEQSYKKKLYDLRDKETGTYKLVEIDVPQEVIPGRSYDDVKHKLKNLRSDLNISPTEHYLSRIFGRSPIGMSRDRIIADPRDGRLFDSNTRYWLNRLYGNTPSGPEVVSENLLAKDYGKLYKEGLSFEEAQDIMKKYNDPIDYQEVPRELPGSPNALKSSLGSVDMSKYEIKNPDYFTKLLDTYDSRKLSPTNKKFYKSLIESVKKQNGIATERQYNELQRLRTGNFNFGKKGYSDGGIIMELSDAEIKEYKKGGWIIEEM